MENIQEQTARKLNQKKIRVIGRARRLCAEMKHTFYLSGLDQKGRMVYRIKEAPAYKLTIEPLL